MSGWFAAWLAAPAGEAQAEGWAAIAGRAHAHPRPDGERQDPGRVPLVPRPPRPRPEPATHPRHARPRPGPVRLPAQGADLRRRAQPPGAPLTGIGLAAQRLGEEPPRITVASRTGDTPAEDRREIARRPPDILITTPESLYLLLTSQAREILRGVEHVIIDEVHAIAGSKRGAHLALSLERLERLRGDDAARRSASA